MSAVDLYAPEFPHSTREGYGLGCRGNSCPGIVDHGMSCAQVFKRSSGDYGFAKKLDAGMSVGDILAAEHQAAASSEDWVEHVVEAAKAHTLVGKDANGELCSCGFRADSILEHLGSETVAATEHTPAEKPKTLQKPKSERRGTAEHGTTAMYSKGCHDGTQCPRGADGKTCREAYQEYQRDYAKRRRENAGKPLVKDTPKPAAPKPAPPAPKPAPPAELPVISAAPSELDVALDLARAEIARLTQENAELTTRLAVVEAPAPEAKHTEVTLADGITLTINVTVGRAA